MIKNKNILICVLVSILIIASYNSVAQKVCIENDIEINSNKDSTIKINNAENYIKIPLSQEDLQALSGFMNNQIVRDVVNDNNIEMGALITAIDTYYGVDDNYDEIINLLISLIEDRLGWVYDGFSMSLLLFEEGKALWSDLQSIPDVANQIKTAYEKAQEVVNLMLHLIKFEFTEFFSIWNPAVIYHNIMYIIDTINSVKNQAIDFMNDINNFISYLEALKDWFNEQHWTDDIYIYGNVQDNNQGISNVEITCKGETTYTDNDGSFDYYVNSQPDVDSFPENNQMGIHNCIIFAEKDDKKAESLLVLSYAFAGGTIEYNFNNFDDGKSKSLRVLNCPLLRSFFERYYNIFSFLF